MTDVAWTDRAFLVVGGTGGVGSAVVRTLVARGASVRFTYLRAAQAARELEKDAGRGPGSAVGVRMDMRSLAGIDEIVAAGPTNLDGVIVCAATGVWESLTASTPKHQAWTFEANVFGLLRIYQQTLPRLASTSGSLIVLTSIGSKSVIPGYGLIGMAKAACESFVRYAAVEGGPFGVRVNGVCPGLMDTKALRNRLGTESYLAEVRRRTPLGQLTTPTQVASIIGWLLSREPGSITGQILKVDGGHSIVSGDSHPPTEAPVVGV